MLLEKIKQFLKLSPNIINKSDVEKIFAITYKGLREDVIPSFEELSKLDNTMFDKNLMSVLGRNLIGKENKDIIKSYKILIDKIIKQEPNIKKLIDLLPENVTTKTITARDAGILNLVSNLNTFVLSSGDIPIVILSTTSEKDFPPKVYQDMKNSIIVISKLVEYLSDLDSLITSITKSDTEVNINEDNVSIEAILKAKGKLNYGFVSIPLPNIPKYIYTLRTWIIDKELEKYELLKLKRQYLLKRLLEIQNELNKNPDDLTLKKAKEVYSKEINTLTYKIEKIEHI